MKEIPYNMMHKHFVSLSATNNQASSRLAIKEAEFNKFLG